jgi:hypothetical protein
VLYEGPMTTFERGNIAALLVMELAFQLGRAGPGGWSIQAENDFVVAGAEVFQPDALGWRKGAAVARVAPFEVIGLELKEWWR